MHAKRVALFRMFAGHLLLALCILLVVPLGSVIGAQTLNRAQAITQQQYQQNSWGLGVVVPDGSSLSGGGTLAWPEVTNITAMVQVPDITTPTAPIYAVVSLMTQDGEVLQTAFGIYPGNGSWLVYSMFIENVNQIPQHYIWVVNSSEPRAEPGDILAISIYQSPSHVWSFRASNLNTSLGIQRAFGTNSTQPPKSGDQEVFALESYAIDSATFKNMGNMTLASLLMDGRKVVSGWYTFADWDLLHNPLFVVGGAAPSPYVGLSLMKDGTAVWYYSGTWKGGGQIDQAGPILVALLILAGAGVGGVMLSMRYIRIATGSRGKARQEQERSDPE